METQKIYKPKDFSKMLNISVKTLQRWDNEKILIAKRTPTNRRYYIHEQYNEFVNGKAIIEKEGE